MFKAIVKLNMGNRGRWTTFDQKHGGNEDDVNDEGGSDGENDAMRMKARLKRTRTRTMKRSVTSGLMTKGAATRGEMRRWLVGTNTLFIHPWLTQRCSYNQVIKAISHVG
jgi:hypothetical protein